MKVSSRRAFTRAYSPIPSTPLFTKAQLAFFTSVAVAFPVLILAVRTAQ